MVEDDEDLYYKAPRLTQTMLKSGTPDWAPWVGFFLSTDRRMVSRRAWTTSGSLRARVRLRELVAAGRVRRHGKARATWYSL